MDNKKLRKISRKELLEILLSQAKRIDELEEKLEKTESKLNSKRITIENSGSLAEASLKLNGIFATAEETAKQYLYNVKEKCKKIESETKKTCQIEKENMIKETEELCAKKKKEADLYLKEIESKIKKLTKEKEKTTTKKKSSSSKKKEQSNIKKENTLEKNTSNVNQNNQDKKSENKLVVEKKKTIKGRPIKTIKKRNNR